MDGSPAIRCAETLIWRKLLLNPLWAIVVLRHMDGEAVSGQQTTDGRRQTVHDG